MVFRKNTELPPCLTYDDLPPWMRKTRRGVDWAFLVVVVLCGVIVWPLFVRSGMPANPGAWVEVVRTVEMAESIQAGVLYPRWAADFNFGYGSPLWNYLAPLPHYLTGWHRVLVQSGPEESVKTIMAASVGLCGLSMFSFVRRRWGTYAGLVAAVTFLFSPQIALVKPYLASDLGGLLATGLFLLALWAFDRLLETQRGWDLCLAAGAVAAVWLAHTPLNLLLVGILAGWLIWRTVAGWGEGRVARWAWLAGGLGTALAVFYWLPAWWERSEVRWLPVATGLPGEQPAIKPVDMLRQPELLDRSAINLAGTLSVGVATWLLALGAIVGVLVWAWHRTPPDRRPVPRGDAIQQRLVMMVRTFPSLQQEAFFFGVIGFALFVVVTPVGNVVWRQLPDWPHLDRRDLLPLVAACGALLAGQIGYLLEQTRRARIVLPVMVGIMVMILVTALPTLALPAWSAEQDETDLLSMLRAEMNGYAVGSQLRGWLLPKTVEDIPPPAPGMIASYESGMVDNVVRGAMPGAVQVDVVDYTPHVERLVVRTGNSIELPLLTFHFAGWQAEINGESVPVRAQPETGLIMVEIPPGRHELVVRFGSTPVRSMAWLVSGAALMVTVAYGFWLENRWVTPVEVTSSASPLVSEYLLPSMLLLVTLIFSVGGALPRLAVELFTLHSPPGVVQPAGFQFSRAVQGGIDLLAYDLEPVGQSGPGDTITLTLYWRAVRPDLPNYQVNVAVEPLGDSQQRIGFAQHRHPGMIPSSQWPLWSLMDRYVVDRYSLRLDKNATNGGYNIIVQVGRCNQAAPFPCETIEPLFVRDGRGTYQGQRIVLPVVITVRP